MTTLFDDDQNPALLAAQVIADITVAYQQKLLLNPPTPAFNTRTNPKAEGFAHAIAPKDVTRFLAVLDGLGLTITPK